jgi:hypothetical protein
VLESRDRRPVRGVAATGLPPGPSAGTANPPADGLRGLPKEAPEEAPDTVAHFDP